MLAAVMIIAIGIWLVVPTFRKDHERPLPLAKIHDGGTIVPHEASPRQFVAGAVFVLGGFVVAALAVVR